MRTAAARILRQTGDHQMTFDAEVWRRAQVAGFCRAVILSLFCAGLIPVSGQAPKAGAPPPKPEAEAPKDHLGRGTPRGTVLGFLNASRKGTDELAVQYLNTRLRGQPAAELARQLFVVLNRLLPPRLQHLSDSPEGSLSSTLRVGQDLVGTIERPSANVDILVERVDRGALGSVWLFSRETLAVIPELYEDVDASFIENVLPRFLVNTRPAGIPLYEWLALFFGLPLLYISTAIVNRLAAALVGGIVRYISRRRGLPNPGLLPASARLLIVALIIYWTTSVVSLPLFARQFWSSLAAVITIVATVWLLIVWNGRLERWFSARVARRGNAGIGSVVRFMRRAADLMAIFIGLLVGLHHFSVNPTAALAGLGVGGIAIALAAQKTLENMIGGFSIIFDKVVHVGDFLKVGETLGTVEQIGLRSTRIRTLDRTIVSIPNGQIANVSLENMSSRDKFWFHHVLGLRYDTTGSQMLSILEELRSALLRHPKIEHETVDVRFLRFGTTSLDVEVFAYIFAQDYVQFLGVQTRLLLQFMEIVEKVGTHVALQTPIISLPARYSSVRKEGILEEASVQPHGPAQVSLAART
jgi:MscS family membrane protein